MRKRNFFTAIIASGTIIEFLRLIHEAGTFDLLTELEKRAYALSFLSVRGRTPATDGIATGMQLSIILLASVDTFCFDLQLVSKIY